MPEKGKPVHFSQLSHYTRNLVVCQELTLCLGTLFGNGEVWYASNNHTNNRQGRPHAISFYNTTNSLIEGLRFIQSQMFVDSRCFSMLLLM